MLIKGLFVWGWLILTLASQAVAQTEETKKSPPNQDAQERAQLKALQNLEGLDDFRKKDLLEYVSLKRQLLRAVRLALVDLKNKSPDFDNISSEKLEETLAELIKKESRRIFSRMNKYSDTAKFKEDLGKRIVGPQNFEFKQTGKDEEKGPKGTFLRPLVVPTRLYKLKAQSKLSNKSKTAGLKTFW